MAVRFLDETQPSANIQASPITPTQETSSPQSTIRFIEEQPSVGKRLLRKTGEVVQQFQKGSEIQARGLGELLGGVTMEEMMKDVPKPQGFLESGARLAGEYLAPSPMVANVPGLGGAINTTSKLLGIAARASKLGLALDSTSKAIMEPIAKTAGKTIGFVGEMLSSVPSEYIERAIKKEVAGDSVFKKDVPILEELGRRAQSAINHIVKKAGEAVGEETKALGRRNILIRSDDLGGMIDNIVSGKEVEGISLLKDADKKEIEMIKEMLKPDRTVKVNVAPQFGEGLVKTEGALINQSEDTAAISVQKMNQIKRKIYQMVKYDPQTVKATSSQGDAVLKEIASELDKRIVAAVPEMGKVNDKFSKIIDLKDRLKNQLKDENVAKNLKNLSNKDEFTRSLFAEVDAIAPDKYKFFEHLQDRTVKDAFDNLFPGRGGGSGSQQGFANILRVAGLSQLNPATIPLVSPKVQQLGIQGAVGAAQAAGGALSRVTPEAAGAFATKTTGREILRRRGE